MMYVIEAEVIQDVSQHSQESGYPLLDTKTSVAYRTQMLSKCRRLLPSSTATVLQCRAAPLSTQTCQSRVEPEFDSWYFITT